jgi:hypothetical protein
MKVMSRWILILTKDHVKSCSTLRLRMMKGNDMFKRMGTALTAFAVGATLPLMVGCNGGSTSGGDSPVDGVTFVSDDESAGRIDIEVNRNVAVGSVAEFKVFVYDAQGRPVPEIQISCDSERGLAIVEPTAAVATTSSGGAISGLIGCASPGSFQFACRVPQGGNRREFVGIMCEGEIPEGFAGFDGAAGGGLGGGVVDPSEGGPGGSGLQLRIVGLEAVSGALGADTSQIDLAQIADCDGDVDTSDPEPFTDDFIRFTIQNSSDELVRFSSFDYSVQGSRSQAIALTNEASADPNATASFEALLFDVASGKAIANASRTALTAGFSNVAVRLYGQSSRGESVTLTASFGLSFDSYNVCGN